MEPQVLVTVNGVEAVCPQMNCNYVYKAPVAKITSQKLTGRTVEIEGTNIPTADVTVELGEVNCKVSTIEATKISCTLDQDAPAGSWNVEVVDSEGRVNVKKDTAKIDVGLEI